MFLLFCPQRWYNLQHLLGEISGLKAWYEVSGHFAIDIWGELNFQYQNPTSATQQVVRRRPMVTQIARKNWFSPQGSSTHELNSCWSEMRNWMIGRAERHQFDWKIRDYLWDSWQWWHFTALPSSRPFVIRGLWGVGLENTFTVRPEKRCSK